MWDVVNFIKTRGKGYLISEGDGLAYSYSVFDSYKIISNWADKIFVIPTKNLGIDKRLTPILGSGHILLCGIKEHDLKDDSVARNTKKRAQRVNNQN